MSIFDFNHYLTTGRIEIYAFKVNEHRLGNNDGFHDQKSNRSRIIEIS